MLPDYLEDNKDDEFVEDEFDEGYIVMDYDEFVEWCESIDN